TRSPAAANRCAGRYACVASWTLAFGTVFSECHRNSGCGVTRLRGCEVLRDPATPPQPRNLLIQVPNPHLIRPRRIKRARDLPEVCAVEIVVRESPRHAIGHVEAVEADHDAVGVMRHGERFVQTHVELLEAVGEVSVAADEVIERVAVNRM